MTYYLYGKDTHGYRVCALCELDSGSLCCVWSESHQTLAAARQAARAEAAQSCGYDMDVMHFCRCFWGHDSTVIAEITGFGSAYDRYVIARQSQSPQTRHFLMARDLH